MKDHRTRMSIVDSMEAVRDRFASMSGSFEKVEKYGGSTENSELQIYELESSGPFHVDQLFWRIIQLIS